MLNNDWTARPWYLDEHLHYTNWVMDQALEFLEHRDPTCPFFLTVSFLAPHPPLQPPAFYFERYLRTGVPDPVIGDWEEPPAHDGLGDDVASPHVHLQGEALLSMRAAYYGAINHIDDQLRRFLDQNTALGRLMSENTIVIFTSDHGEMLGRSLSVSQDGPLRRLGAYSAAGARAGAVRREAAERVRSAGGAGRHHADRAGIRGTGDSAVGGRAQSAAAAAGRNAALAGVAAYRACALAPCAH